MRLRNTRKARKQERGSVVYPPFAYFVVQEKESKVFNQTFDAHCDMHKIETQIEIAAPARRVWSLLIDFASYPEWNPFIRSIEGRLEVGQSLRVFIQPPGFSGMRFKPTVLAAEQDRELRWKGKLLFPGLFDGEHCFKIESKPGGVTLHQGETFHGVLVPLFRSSLDGATTQGFVAMNTALKERAEKYDA